MSEQFYHGPTLPRLLCAYLYLMSKPFNSGNIVQATSIGVEEDDGLETGKLRLVQVDVAKRIHQFVHHANPNVLNHGVLGGGGGGGGGERECIASTVVAL